ncbi:acetyl-CoA C-acyltransferase [Paraglaciecola chathamensis]|jgi:acetyl-CoA C-acetyltransferase|uniref:Acetyl-CoA acetyltransferase n=1 Tax=Paraglaciecola chathamensis TaxID=368405 RepID=A0A8H9M4J3_9ALTE|nr:acetyl-CoA C-acyltransferase [Paraglaciecola oceanifecundans]GGZ64026.1 acetyl-CoA acetyltransferase [Paraglaciecola oceanifecundans]
MNSAYIYDVIRSPRGKAKPEGGLHDVSAFALLSALYGSLETRTGLQGEYVTDVILGCATQVNEQAGNIAKTSTMYHGWPGSVSGLTVNRYCSSGIDAVNIAAMKVMTGMDDLTIAGGVEMLSRTPMFADKPSAFMDLALSSKMGMFPMGNGADLVASQYKVTREQADQVALLSHQRAAHARDNHYFKSIIPIVNPQKGITFHQDELIRDTSLEVLAQMKPSFAKLGEQGIDALYLRQFPQLEEIVHVHTPANSPSMADGAALSLIGSLHAKDRLNVQPRAKISAMCNYNGDTRSVITGAVAATQALLKRENMQASDIDLFEIHEAFAATMVMCKQSLGIGDEKLNVNGGCIALGHPLGATGTIMLATLLDELERRDLTTGIVAASGAAGSGSALMIERV